MTTKAEKTKIDPMDRRHPEHEAYMKWLRGLTMEERRAMIVEECRKAAAAEQARIAAGLGPTPKEPFPESTMEHFRRWTAEYRKRLETEKRNDAAPDDVEVTLPM